jgi:hypothetical protein
VRIVSRKVTFAKRIFLLNKLLKCCILDSGSSIIGKRKRHLYFNENDQDEDEDILFSDENAYEDYLVIPKSTDGLGRNLRFLVEGDLSKNNDRAIALMDAMLEKMESIENDLGELYGEYFMINFKIEDVHKRGLTKFIKDLGIP